MIKKILMMSAGVVLGGMITTASFAHRSEDCDAAKTQYKDVLESVQIYRDYGLPRLELKIFRQSKRACMRVVRAVCHHGSYADADPDDVEICNRVVVDRDEDGDILGGMFENDNGYYAVASIERDDKGNIVSITMETYTQANDVLVAIYVVLVERDDEGNIISITIRIYDGNGNLVATYAYP